MEFVAPATALIVFCSASTVLGFVSFVVTAIYRAVV